MSPTRSSPCPATAPNSSTATSSASTAASSSPAHDAGAGAAPSHALADASVDLVPMSGRVIVVSSVNVDLVVSVDRLPGPGETVTGGRFDRHHGGKGGNQAVAAARLGVPAVFVGAVGDDTVGGEGRAAPQSEGGRRFPPGAPAGQGAGGGPVTV